MTDSTIPGSNPGTDARQGGPLRREIDTPDPIDLLVETGRGTVLVTLAETATTTVEVSGRDSDRVRVETQPGAVRVLAPRGGLFSGDPRLDVSITLPTGSTLDVRTGSADITVHGTAGDVTVKTGSGQVRLDEAASATQVATGSGDVHVVRVAADLSVRTGSGDLHLEQVQAGVSVATGSGDVRVDRADLTEQLSLKSGSGDVLVGSLSGDLTFATGSGDLHAALVHRGAVTVRGASGDVRLGVPAGVPVWTDVNSLSGGLRSTLAPVGAPEPGQDFVEVRATTVSGDVTLHPA
ncbi:DUF4097 family beta strand repeat-containing protein [Nocardioides sp. GY 10127]|uniref:DUF4097 family beta strand repeat-containing protein n=1 Tax=Nocardioides sp. GY 10127 TaxID=2569762 RepID=UPI0010A933DB|nr:DUF4097 family beta strand repeat-containing protein [Nocardioides sp. GY 10127]TIC82936.1 DUF4097 domain-containing protein [Nocardioides sp. GY 10127]